MLSELLQHPRALLGSVLLHLAVIGLMVINLSFFDKPSEIKVGAKVPMVEAEIIEILKVIL